MTTTRYDPSSRLALATRQRGATVKVHDLPEAVAVQFGPGRMAVHLRDGREVRIPLAWLPWLQAATETERGNVELVCNGIGLHWPDLDEDVFVLDLLAPEVVPLGGR